MPSERPSSNRAPSSRPFGPEGPECEWKRKPPAPAKLARTLAAFHNGTGGSVWVGVEDDGTLVGVEDLAETKAALEEAVNLVEPNLGYGVHKRRVEGFTLVEVRVASGKELARAGGKVYLRDGDSSRAATAEQERRLERSSGRVSLDERSRKLLDTLKRKGPLRRGDLAKAMRVGERTCRRTLVPLLGAGYVMESHDGHLSLTPSGHRRS